MSVKRRTISQRSEIIHDLHVFNINPDTRELFIHSVDNNDLEEPGIDYRTATMLEKNLGFLQNCNDQPILIHMHTVGGNWNDGMAIYDAIKQSQVHVTILAYAYASSMGSIILQAADTRIMMPNADFMIHYGSLSIDSNTISVISATEWEKKLNNKMLDIYVDACLNGSFFKQNKMNDKRIKKFLDNKIKQYQEWYLNASDAVYYGFADGILGDSTYPNVQSLLETS